MDEEDLRLWRELYAAVERPEVDAALGRFFADLDQVVADAGARCWLSGRCCDFEAYGHRLYVTGLEVAWFVRREHPRASGVGAGREVSEGRERSLPVVAGARGCPYQVNRLCQAHTSRPMGCRIFFCQAGTEQWQEQVYERFLGRLRRLHEEYELPYRYIEWRQGLGEALALW